TLSCRPSAVADAGNGAPLNWCRAEAEKAARNPSAVAVAEEGTERTPALLSLQNCSICQMSRAYSDTVRSLENLPMRATLRIALWAQPRGHLNSSPIVCCVVI